MGQVPDAWKIAVVTPVYKKAPSSDPTNYRPISQTSNFWQRGHGGTTEFMGHL